MAQPHIVHQSLAITMTLHVIHQSLAITMMLHVVHQALVINVGVPIDVCAVV